MMYTGRYRNDGEMQIPDGYDGTMLGDDSSQGCDDPESVGTNAKPALLSGIFRGGLDGILKIPLLKGLNLGIEEILIGATALFLLTSKNGDKECAIMLLLLLFVT